MSVLAVAAKSRARACGRWWRRSCGRRRGRRAEVVDEASALIKRATQLAATCGAGGLQVAEADGLVSEFGADGAAEKHVAVKDADLGHVARVIADGDRLADVGGEREVQVAQASKPDAVAMHDAGLGDGEQQQVELLE